MPKKTADTQTQSFPFRQILALTGFILFYNFSFFRSPSPWMMALQILAWMGLGLAALTKKRWSPMIWGIVVVSAAQSINVLRLSANASQLISLASMAWGNLLAWYLLASDLPWVRSLMEAVMAPVLVGFAYLRATLLIT